MDLNLGIYILSHIPLPELRSLVHMDKAISYNFFNSE